MHAPLPKVWCKVARRSMLEHVVDVASLCARKVLLVLSEKTAEEARTRFDAARFPQVLQTVQRTQDGTGGAAACALAYAAEIKLPAKTFLFLNGDAPLLSAEDLRNLVRTLEKGGVSLALLGFASENSFGYGRLLGANIDRAKREDLPTALVDAVREEADCTSAERALPFCNAGVYASCLALGELQALLARLPSHPPAHPTDKSSAERRMPDVVERYIESYGGKVAVCWTSEDEARGVNTPAELALAERLWQQRKRRQVSEQGVSMLAPETVFFSYDTSIGKGTVIEPYVVFGEKVSIGEEVSIGSFSHLAGARVAARASVGPFARLRPTSTLGEGAKVGNFVETKNANLARQAKASHLAYLGDCSIGEAANIGAGVITCNYDGTNKHRTQIGAQAFVGSNSSLIAPLTVGARARIGASSAITDDVPADTLVFERNAVTAKALVAPLGEKSASDKDARKNKSKDKQRTEQQPRRKDKE